MADDKVTIIVEADDRASGKLDTIGGKLGGLGNTAMTVAGVGLAAVGAGIAGVGAVIGATLPKAIDFESSLAELKIAAGSADLSMDDLREAALAVGGDMKLIGVDASGAATAMTGLYKAGLDTTEIFGDVKGYMAGTAELGGALRASIDLAAASELDMVQASDLAAIALATFGGEMETAEERAEFVNFALDNTVRAADASVASVSDIAAAMTNIGPTASALGIGIDDVNNALAILSTRGISGAEAGTALKSMLTNLQRATPEVTGALDELGVSLYDAEGQFRGLPALVEDLERALFGVSETTVEVGGRTAEQNDLLEAARKRYETLTERVRDHEHGLKTMSDKALEKVNAELAASAATIEELEGITGEYTTTTTKLTDEQRNLYIQTIAGTYGMNALNTLLSDGHEGWDQMIKDTADATGMMEQAAIKSDTFAMKIEALTGVLETMAIEIGTPVLDFLSRLIDTVAGPGFAALEPFVEMWERIWGWFDNVFTLLTEEGYTLTDIFTIFEDGSSVIEGFFKALGLAEEPARNISQALSEVVTFMNELFVTLETAVTKIGEFMTPVWEWITQTVELKDIFIALGIAIGGVLLFALAQLAIAIGPFVLALGGLILAVALVRQAWEGNWMGIRDKLTEVWTAIQPKILELYNWLQTNIPLAIAALSNWWDNTFVPALQRVWGWIQENLLPKFNDIKDWLVEKIPAAIEEVRDWWDEEFIPAMERVRNWIVENLVPKFEDIAAWLQTNIPIAVKEAKRWFNDEFIPAMRDVRNWIATYLIPKFKTMEEWLLTNIPIAIRESKRWFLEEFKPAMEKVRDYIEDPLIPTIKKLANTMAEDMGSEIEEGSIRWQNYKLYLTTVHDYIKDYLLPIKEDLTRIGLGVLNLWLLIVGRTWIWFRDEVLGPVYELIRDDLLPKLKEVKDLFELDLNPQLLDATTYTEGFRRALTPLSSILSTVHGWLKNVADTLDRLPNVLPSWLQHNSPTPFEMALRGINDALIAVNPNLAAFNTVATVTARTGMPLNTSPAEKTENHYHYHLNVSSTQSQRDMTRDFNLMRAMAG